MTSFHDRIMNIQADYDTHDYKIGHRNARHDAAGIVVEADVEIERLNKENAELRAEIDDLKQCAEDFAEGHLQMITRRDDRITELHDQLQSRDPEQSDLFAEVTRALTRALDENTELREREEKRRVNKELDRLVAAGEIPEELAKFARR